MKVFIDKDEWWPVYYYSKQEDKSYGNPAYLIEVPEEVLERYDAAAKAFERANFELGEYAKHK